MFVKKLVKVHEDSAKNLNKMLSRENSKAVISEKTEEHLKSEDHSPHHEEEALPEVHHHVQDHGENSDHHHHIVTKTNKIISCFVHEE